MILFLLLIAVLLLIVDELQTLRIKSHPELYETNALLGRHPSARRIIGYFAVCIGALSELYVHASPLIVTPVCITVCAIEITVIVRNYKNGIRIINQGV